MKTDFVTIGKCAKAIGIDKSNLFRNLKAGKYGNVKVKFIRDKAKNNQKVSVISKEDFEKIKKIRLGDGFGIDKLVDKGNVGVFYIVQTNPKSIPNRYKCGFSTNTSNRISSYRTICPNTKLIFKIKCGDFLEKPLLKMISRNNKQIGVELFEIEDIGKIKHKIKEILKLLK